MCSDMQTMSIFPAIGNNFLENLSGSLIRIVCVIDYKICVLVITDSSFSELCVMLDSLLRFYNTLLNMKLFYCKLLTGQNTQQFQKKIRDLEKMNRDLDSKNHDLDSKNHDLSSNNQILINENMQLKDSLSKELSLWSSRQNLNIPVNADRASLLHRL